MSRKSTWLAVLAVMLQSGSLLSGWREPTRVMADEVIELPVADPAPDAKPAEGEKKPDDTPPPRTRRAITAPANPRAIKFVLQDGSIIAGDLEIDEIKVTTSFGELTVPIAKLISFTPGLDSNQQLSGDLAQKFKDLASEDYKTREQAHKDLVSFGRRILQEIDPLLDSENAEVKRHATEIVKEIEAAGEAESEEEGEKTEMLIRPDTIETIDFTMVGKISPPTFGMKTKFGQLKVNLGDIRRAERSFDVKEMIKRSFSVQGQNLIQRQMKSTGIRVNAGDRIAVTAEGNIVLSPWGSNALSSPDGAQNYGWYIVNQIPAGALCARIGDKGEIMKVGSKTSFVAKSSGTLFFGVAMMNEYSHEGYQFPGEFKVKLKVEPK